MSSELDKESSTPETPRKRRRLHYRNPSHSRKHDAHRRPDLEEKYNDNYRLLYNEHVALAVSRFEVNESVQHYSNQVGASVWSSQEQAVFFAALERLGKDDLPGISKAVATKTETEARDFLLLLQNAAVKQGNAQVTLRDIPAAIEIDRECSQWLEEASDALVWYQEKFEADQEQERYGEYWLITPQIAAEIEDAIDQSGSTSTPQENEANKFGPGVAGACAMCKKRKLKCDRRIPCTNCARFKADCVYLKNPPDAIELGPTHMTMSDGDKGIKSQSFGGAFDFPNLSRAASAPQLSETETFGRGVAGACTPCKKRKIKCDRGQPCNKCTWSKTECVYPGNSRRAPRPSRPDSRAQTAAPNDPEAMHDRVEEPLRSKVIRAIPEADLLKPQMMLTLSKHLFMNRSADMPSHWPHWSAYISELATEPSMYRTAFNDFHRLVISVTKRLVQTTIIQATSRLRAQRLRNGGGCRNKGLLPFVKQRDVYAAIEVLGMKQDGSDRWRGVPRRCSLRVVVKEKTYKGSRQKEVPWSEVERLMNPAILPSGRSATEVEMAAEPETLRSRAARSGTPLPTQNIVLSDSDEDFEPTEHDDDADAELIYQPKYVGYQSLTQNVFPPRDRAGRYASVAPTVFDDETVQQLCTLEEFDKGASRQEERALWQLLGQERPPSKKDLVKDDDNIRDDNTAITEKIFADSDNWRKSVDFCATWETYEKPISVTKFLANQKSPSPMPNAHTRHLHRTGEPSGVISDHSSTIETRKSRRNSPVEVELRPRGTNAYAALQRDDLGRSVEDHISKGPGLGLEFEKDVPTQSIEAEHDAGDIEVTEDEMDWTRHQDSIKA